MAIDTPARIAVLGAGPVGLEAALYARFLGYDVSIYERGRIAENVQARGHLTLYAPFRWHRSALGLAALAAQDPAFQPPGDAELLSGRDLAARYLLPLAETDLLSGSVHLGCEVLAVGKDELLQGEFRTGEDRGDYDFRLLVRSATGVEEIRKADAVLDTTGAYGNPNWLGQGGIPAAGEGDLRGEIEYGLPDILGASLARYAGLHTLVVGGGHGAAHTVCALAELARSFPGTRVTWITRREPIEVEGPVRIVPDDPFPERSRVCELANSLARQGDGPISWRAATFVDALHRTEQRQFAVTLSGRHAAPFECDQIISNVGYRPDFAIHRELHVEEQLEGPVPTVETKEPNYYVLGAKSFGRRSGFLPEVGHQQIRRVFAIIGDRPSLDLYAGARQLLPAAQ